MKRVYLLTLLLVATVVTIFDSPIPRDQDLRHGVLANSLQYYIRHNALPKGQADFYILSDVGAIQEDDDQQGLAHFLEHMAFNGTKNLPEKEIINYLESVGVKFGANLNAATSWDYTVYMMKDLPTARPSVVDSALLILHDWAGFIEPQPSEIDKERGVIKEELRTRDGADWRSTLSLIGALGRGTKYEHRNLIGYLEGLDEFEHDALVRFYHDWYTPNHQAIIIAGDVDVDRVEAQLIKQFKKLPAAKRKAPKKEVIKVADNAEPIVEIYADPEMQYSSVQYYIRREADGRAELYTEDFARKVIEESLIMDMQNSRIVEVAMSPDAPILSGGMSLGRVGVIPTLEATSYGVQSPDGGIKEALREVVEQMERTRRYGFEQSELDRAKDGLMSQVRSQYLSRNDRTNNSYINSYISNYRFGTPIPCAEDEWKIDSVMISTASLESVNRRVSGLFRDESHVVMVRSPQKEGLAVPTKESLLSIIQSVQSSDIERYEDREIGDSLIPEGADLSGSKVISESVDSEFGITEWRLANGIQVVVRPSTLKADEVILQGYSYGGASQLDDSEYLAGLLLSSVMRQSGVGEFSAVELERFMAGKMANLSTWVSDNSHGVRGGSTPADLETLMQLLYVNLTYPRFSQEDFEVLRRRFRSNNENQESDPDYLSSKRFSEVVYNNNLRKRVVSIEMIDGLELGSVVSAREKLFSDCDNLRFTIVGNVDLELLKPLVERYIGSLSVEPSNSKMSYRDLNIRPAKGLIRDDFKVRMEQPKVGVQVLYSGADIEFSLRNIVTASYLKAALDDLLLESVREQLGGTYGVGVGASLSKTPYPHFSLIFRYDTNEEQIELLQKTIFEQLELLAKDGASAERMAKSREYMIKSFGNSKEHNSPWIGYIDSKYNLGLNYIADYEATINSITSEDVKVMSRKILDSQNRIEVIMHPEK